MKQIIIFLLLAGIFHPINGQDERPNIVLILADDLGYSDLGCYGGEIATPNIDKLASEGVQFTNFYNAARCCPSRASLLTGLYPHQAGIGNMVYRDQGEGYRGYLTDNTVTLAEVLKEAGYKTMMSGKWHVGHKDRNHWPTARGFDRFFGIHSHVDSYWKVLEGSEVYLDGIMLIPKTDNPINHLFPKNDWYSTDVFTDNAIQFLNEEVGQKSNQKPFFLYMAYNAPHFPLEAHDETIEKYQGNYMDGWKKLRIKKFNRMKQMGLVSPDVLLPNQDGPNWDDLSINDKKNLDFRRSIYAAQIDELDQNIGRLIKHLKLLNVYENTLIIFLSDNGSSAETGMFGMNWEKNKLSNFDTWKKSGGWSISQGKAWANVSNAPYKMYKKFTYQGGIATPFIVNWPRKFQVDSPLNKNMGHIIDIMPTLVEVSEAKYPKYYKGSDITPMEGKSLLPIIQESSTSNHEYVYWEHIGNRAVRNNQWKLVALANSDWKLYNIDKDPTEIKNIINENPDLAKKLIKKYEQWANEVGVKPWPINKVKK